MTQILANPAQVPAGPAAPIDLAKKRGIGFSISEQTRINLCAWIDAENFTHGGAVITEMVRVLKAARWQPGRKVALRPRK